MVRLRSFRWLWTGTNHGDAFQKTIHNKVRRHNAAKRRSSKDVIFWLGMFGLVGWSIAIPTVVGTALGVWLDEVFPSPASWTLTFMLLGVGCGCLIAWRWIRQEMSDG